MQRIIDKIKTNKIKCKKCGDIIESTSVHDFKWCSCGTVAVDGGHEYLRRLGNEEDFEDLSHVMKLVEIKTDGFKVIKNALYKKDDNRKCPNCNSDNVTYAKGDGELIIGDDFISLACHDCETIFEFINVKYKELK